MNTWRGKHVVIIGAARQGVALARYLAGRGASVILTDRRQPEDLTSERQALQDCPIEWRLGGHPLGLLDGADLLCLSGGVPLDIPIVQEALRLHIPLSNDSQIFLEAAPCKVIGITGSAGKTTTTALVGRMAEAYAASLPVDGRRPVAWVGGNIGNPLISDLEKMHSDDLVVMELSSFQLEQMTRAPQVAGILNITPNHLDRHGSMDAYIAAKARILQFQTSADTAVLGRDEPNAWGLAKTVRGALLSFGLTALPAGQSGTFLEAESLMLQMGEERLRLMETSQISLRGEHNRANVLAACALAAAAGLPSSAMQAGVEGFGGVAHRLEYVRSWRGAAWYNDSIATAPERAMAAVRSFTEPLILLVGGRDKNLPWEDFVRLIQQRVDHLVLFGELADLVATRLEATSPLPYTVHRCTGLHTAVQTAAELVQPGDVVLLSPGGTSFDEFKDFEERGRLFRLWVNELS